MSKENLKKNLSFIDVFCIASGAMISSGIFILPGIAFKDVGPAVFLSYLLAGIIALVGALAVIELSTAMPRAGGDYFFIERSLGPLVGTVSGFLSWFALALKTSFAIFGLAEVVHIFTGLSVPFVGIIAAALFVVINIVGVKEAAWLEVVMVFGLLLILGAYVILGFTHVSVSNFDPFLAVGKRGDAVLDVAALVFISFGGLLTVTSVSEEVKNPRKNIPLGMISSVIVVTIIYTLILIVTVGILPAGELSGSMTPLADAARKYIGSSGYYVITIAAVLAFVTTANAGIMSASRYPMALSRDDLVPESVSKVHKKLKTPVFSIIITGVVIMLSLLMPLATLVKAASTVVLSSYILTNMAVIILRESRIQNYRPSFRSPLYPWLQFISIVFSAGMIIKMGFQAIEISLGIMAAGMLVYLFFGRKVSHEYALLHLVERLTNKKLTTHGLEGELREILHQRDDVVKDEFDVLVEEAPVIILDGTMDVDELFHRIAEKLADDFSLSEDEMYKLLREREDESSTAITPGVAIPHIIVEQENCFRFFMIKCSEGVRFSDENDNINAIFLLIGSRDQRNHHLKALAAIAQIIQDYRFEDTWENAHSEKQLRDVLLLGKRKRVS
jgi:amino acid transporter/mannitol/fructose-specific phosphotransferase system IIA component (Ntr-type)